MSDRSAFETLCQQVCSERGWTYAADAVEVHLENGRRQRVQFTFFRYQQRERARLCSVIGDSRRIDPVRLGTALDLNYRLPHGALAKRGDELVLVDTLLVDEADSGEIATTIAYLSETADHYERTMFGPDVH